MDKLLTPKEAAERLGVSLRRAQKLCKDGRLGFRVGNRYVIPESSLVAFQSIARKVGRPFKR
jgi:excisionase family DNA binding protein